MSYQLSICIPTYNREKYLKELLDCILRQLNDIEENIVEICVSDNASTDNTQTIMQQYQEKYSNITYFRWDKNMGADINYLKAVEIAHGKYCWFFGSDDLMINGAIKQILEEIKENYDIYLCNRYQCDVNMNILSKYNLLKNDIDTGIFEFGNEEKISQYLKSVNHLEGFFSYLSSIIFKKEQWDSVEFDKSFIGTCYSLTYVFLSLLKTDIKLKYVKDYLVLYRNENDSLANEGMIKRRKLDFDGYKKLFTTVFYYNKELANYYKVVLKNAFSSFLLASIYEKANITERQELISFIKETHNIYAIKFLSSFYYIYRNFLKKTLKKLNIHQKIIKLLS